MEIRLTNSLSNKLEVFKPLKPGKLGLYVCGLTPYDSPHLGHGRAYVFFDVARRTFEAAGFEVKHIQNFTDIDDKILERSQKEGISPILFAGRYIDEFFEAMKALNVLSAHHYPRVTQYIPQIIEAIQHLIHTGHAYAAANGDVYFRTSTFKDYGKLSKKKLEDLIAGARVEVSPHKKEPGDFALWKADSESALNWKSPWGQGRPGWHIECSVMSKDHLDQPFDIHGGGEDLIFPHHENEIAQSEAPEGKTFARYFLHNGFITLNREKMSKSLGNFFSLKDLLAKNEGRIIRYYLISEHYRRPLEFGETSLADAANGLGRLQEAMNTALFVTFSANGKLRELSAKKGPYSQKVLKQLSQDFDTHSALTCLYEWAANIFQDFKSRKLTPETAKEMAQDGAWALENLLGISMPLSLPKPSTEALKVIEDREKARKEKDFAKADSLRKELQQKHGLLLEDTPYGQRLKKVNL